MNDSSDVLKKAIDKVGVKAVVNQLDVSQPYVYKWLQGKDGSGTRNPLDRIKAIVEITDDTSPIDWLCKNFDGTFVKDRNDDKEFELLDFVKFNAEFGPKLLKLNESIMGALVVDQKIDKEGYEDIKSKWYELKQVVEGFVQSCKISADNYDK